MTQPRGSAAASKRSLADLAIFGATLALANRRRCRFVAWGRVVGRYYR